MEFWILIAVICLVTCALLGRTLMHGRNAEALPEFSQSQKEFYQARITELEAEHRLGRLDDDALEAAKTEEARRLIKAGNTSPLQEQTAARTARIPLLISILFLPIFSLAVYASLGSPQFATVNEPEPQEIAVGDLEGLLKAAEKRLEQKPDDAQGWAVVAPVYVRLGQFDKALTAFSNAIRLDPKNIGLKMNFAELLVGMNDGNVPDQAFALYTEVFNAQPDNRSAQFMVGLANDQRGNFSRAHGTWQRMIDTAQGDEPWLDTVRTRLAASKERVKSIQQSEQIRGMVDGLAARLEDDPDDKEGWERLIRSYMILGELDKARTAVESASTQFAADADFLERMRTVGDELERVRADQ